MQGVKKKCRINRLERLGERNERKARNILKINRWTEEHEEYVEEMGKLKYEIDIAKRNANKSM